MSQEIELVYYDEELDPALDSPSDSLQALCECGSPAYARLVEQGFTDEEAQEALEFLVAELDNGSNICEVLPTGWEFTFASHDEHTGAGQKIIGRLVMP